MVVANEKATLIFPCMNFWTPHKYILNKLYIFISDEYEVPYTQIQTKLGSHE